LLRIDHFFSSPLRVGRGMVRTEHGLLPIPAPATAELLRGVPVYAGELDGEYVTPTGAAILTSLCESFGPMPSLEIEQLGYGAGSRDPAGFPNVLRLMLAELEEDQNLAERVMVIETNIDDMSPQVYGFVMERALSSGALDIFFTPVQMKKDRPGIVLTLLCKPEKLDALCELLLTETTTLGVRYYETARRVLERLAEVVQTPYGAVNIKVARQGDRTLHFQPEFEDCARLAIEAGVSLIEVQERARFAYFELMRTRESR